MKFYVENVIFDFEFFLASKPIPIMLLGVLIGRKTYTFKKYIFVLIIVISVAVFSWHKKADKEARDDHITGMSLIAFSLLMDGMMGALQDRMRSVKTPTPLNLMLFINAWSSLYLAFLLVFTLEGYDFILFCMDHYQVVVDLCVVIFVGSIAQFFISEMISSFGALALSLVLTFRKFITVFLSVLIYGHTLSIEQWIAAVFIFGALILDAWYQHKEKTHDVIQVEANDEDKDVGVQEKEEEEMVKKENV
jgi:solute carrier family 35 (UDP-galactose transporter), member B1